MTVSSSYGDFATVVVCDVIQVINTKYKYKWEFVERGLQIVWGANKMSECYVKQVSFWKFFESVGVSSELHAGR